jgi:hypothetical protein
VFICYYLLHYNNLLCVKTSNFLLGLVTTIVVHFFTDLTSWLIKQIWLFPCQYWFWNPVRIHGMKITDMIRYDRYFKEKIIAKCHVFTPTHDHKTRTLFHDKLIMKVKGYLFDRLGNCYLFQVFSEFGFCTARYGARLSLAELTQSVDVTKRTTSRDVSKESTNRQ